MWNAPEPAPYRAPVAAFPPPGSLGRAHPDSIVVQPGQTLFDVARLYDIPTRAVIDANHLEPPYGLIAGQRLMLPQIRTHLVRGGDTIYSVARAYGVEASTLVATNHLPAPYTIFSGTVLVLPPQAASSGGYSASIVATPLPPPSQAAAQPAIPAPPSAPAARPSPPSGPRPSPPSSSSPTGIAEAPLAPPPAPPIAQPPPPGPVIAPAPRTAATTQPAPVVSAPPAVPPAPAPAVSPPAAPPNQTASLALPPPPPRSGRSFLWPVPGKVVARFGPVTGGTQNDGINISAAEGTPVVAADAGTVAYAGNELRGYGNLILIKHADGWMTAYAHNSKLLVTRGQKVQRGQVIGRVGTTGAVSEPQLHFEVRRGSRALDPMDYLGPQSVSG